MTFATARSLVGFLTIAILAGCGGADRPATAPVSGTVTVDGEAVEGAAVMFVPEKGGRPATGTTDAQGHFTLRTIEKGDGAVLGSHQVAITLAKTTGGPEALEGGTMGEVSPRTVQTEWIVPRKYSDPKTSGLTKMVAEGDANTFTFDLKSGS